MTELGDSEKAATSPVKTTSKPSAPKWELAARETVTTGLKKISKALSALEERDAVEADTRILVTDVLCDLLGFDKYEELTAEYSVKGEFADYGIRLDKQMVAFVEVKRIAQNLNASHLRQVETYCLKQGVQWAILTNARHWQLYNVQAAAGELAETNLVLEVDLLSADLKPRDKVERLLTFSRVGFTKGLINDAWRRTYVSSPRALTPVLFSASVLGEIRKELWRQQKVRVDDDTITASLRKMLHS